MEIKHYPCYINGEWNNASIKSKNWMYSGLAVMAIGIVVVAYGNFIVL